LWRAGKLRVCVKFLLRPRHWSDAALFNQFLLTSAGDVLTKILTRTRKLSSN